MKILFQEVYLASIGGYLHVRIVSGVPPLNLRLETMLSDSASEPLQWGLNLEGLLRIVRDVANPENAIQDLQPMFRLFEGEISKKIHLIEHSSIPENICYGDVKVSRHGNDTIILSQGARCISLHRLTAMSYVMDIVGVDGNLDPTRLSLLPREWRAHTLSPDPNPNAKGFFDNYVVVDSETFITDLPTGTVTIRPGAPDDILRQHGLQANLCTDSKETIQMKLTHLIDLASRMLFPMHDIDTLPAYRKYLTNLQDAFAGAV